MKQILFLPVSVAGSIVAARVDQLDDQQSNRERRRIFKDVESILKATKLIPKNCVAREAALGSDSAGVPGILVSYEVELTPITKTSVAGA